jgi:hypothetical protein
MSKVEETSKISISEFDRLIKKYKDAIESDVEFSKEEYLVIFRLWNTLQYNTTLQSSPLRARFSKIVFDKVLPKAQKALNMVVSRGFSFYSKEFDFYVGGILEKRFRYHIEDLENTKE